MREVPLGEVLTPVSERVPLQPDTQYKTVGILNYGRGLFERPVVYGRDVSYRDYFRVAADQFVYSKLFAWEGALTTVERAFDGYFVSQEFPTFNLDMTMALPGYLRLVCQWPAFWSRVAMLESGMGGRRKRVHPDRLLSTTVPLPTVAEQRRIVDLIEATDTALTAATVLAVYAVDARNAIVEQLLNEQRVVSPPTQLGYVAEVNPKEPQLPTDAPFAPMDAVESGARWIRYTEPRGERSGARARSGDTLFARITPCLENGKVAQVQRDLERVGGSTEFIVLRAGPLLDPDFLYLWATAPGTRTRATALMTGTTGRQRLAAADLAKLPITLPSYEDQLRAVALITAIDDVARTVRDSVSATKALRNAILNDLLSGEREIPDVYERLLDAAS